jgi:superfamily II RNA helicase
MQYRENTINYIETSVRNQLILLEKGNFIENNKLTQKGMIARKIKEIDSLVTTNILLSDFVENIFANKKVHKIVALFTLLCDGKDNDYIEISEEHYDILIFLRNQYILINRELMEPVLDWYEGKNSREISSLHGIHEGDLIKTVNKLVHILEDVSQIFLMINKIEYIDIITQIKTKLNRDLVIIESLYLKIS